MVSPPAQVAVGRKQTLMTRLHNAGSLTFRKAMNPTPTGRPRVAHCSNVQYRVIMSVKQELAMAVSALPESISVEEAFERLLGAFKMKQAAIAAARAERIRAALAVCGKYRDPAGSSDVAQDHDRYLAEAYAR